MKYYLTEEGRKFKKSKGTTIPPSQWNPIPKEKELTRGVEHPGYVIPKDGDMTTIDPRTKLPMIVSRAKARGDLKPGATRKRRRGIDPDSNQGAGQEPEI